MKNRMMIMAVGVLMVCLLPMVTYGQQEWQSTSTMQSGSSYSPQVTAVGAVTAAEMATTTANYSPASAPGGPRRTPINNDEGDGDEGWTPKTDSGGTDLSPIGDAVLPLLLMAMAFAGVIYFRKRHARA